MEGANEQSLRFLVEKWLAPGPMEPVHVTKFGRTRSGRRRYVCVEVAQPSGVRALFFFRHDDGCWYVFPPAGDRPNMAANSIGVTGH